MISNDYVLYDDRGLKVDFFLHLLEDFEDIGVMLSGGPDSAFVLYWLAKCIHENKLSNTILPMTGYETVGKYQPYNEIKSILSFVDNEFPNANMLDSYVYYYAPWRTANKFESEGHKKKFVESGLIDHYINGVVAGPLFEDIYFGDTISVDRDLKHRDKAVGKRRGPFQQVDKKFIAYQYKKYNLMDSLYPHTVSCIAPKKNGDPCQRCWWCKERYWAFSSYDRGLIGEPPLLRTKQEMYDRLKLDHGHEHKKLMNRINQ